MTDPCYDAAKVARMLAFIAKHRATDYGHEPWWVTDLRAALAGTTPAAAAGANTVDQERLYATTDAMVWAEEFAKVCPDVDQGLMLSWFANAIEVGRAAGPSGLPDPPTPADPLTEAKIAEAIAVARANQAFANRLAERIEADRGVLDRLAGGTPAEPPGLERHEYVPTAGLFAGCSYGATMRDRCGLPADHPVHQVPADVQSGDHHG